MLNHKFIIRLVNVRTGYTRIVIVMTNKSYINSCDIPGYQLHDAYYIRKEY